MINQPCLKFSNIPTKLAYEIYLSQLIRVCRICIKARNFDFAMQKITLEFVNKSFDKAYLTKIFMRFIGNYEKEWCKFGVLPEIPACLTQ